MATRREILQEIGGFEAFQECLADDYHLGNRIARTGRRIDLLPTVVECRSAPAGWAAVWRHQLRWARTIRVTRPLPYFLSILSNATLWPLAWVIARPGVVSLTFWAVTALVRCAMAFDLQNRLARARVSPAQGCLAPLKDLLHGGIWIAAHLGNRIEWRGEKLRLRRDGTLVKSTPAK
jgi:ceramide glucosyltransferase